MGKVIINNLNKSFINDGKVLQVLNNICLTLNENEFVSVIGPSGCGKSTIFRILAGLDEDFSGEITVNGKPVTEEDHHFCYMQQKDLLMPWRTVLDNILLPLEISEKRSKGKKVLHPEVMNLIRAFGLEGFEEYMPYMLSGGMRQRVAILRTFLMKGNILLLDEPFGALDAITRSKMQEWLMNIRVDQKKAVLFITHDIDEAIFLSDRVYALSDRPATIRCDMEIRFKRPRTREILLSEAFLNYKKTLMEAL